MSATRDSAADASVDDLPGVTAPKPVDEPETWGWTRTHRIGIGVIVIATAAVLTVTLLLRPASVNDPIVVVNGAAVDLPVNIDPNTADVASLSRIPGVGEKTAQAIVDYREAHRADVADGIVYRKLDDLVAAVKVRNAKARDACRSYMVFPDESAPSPRHLKPAARVPDTGPSDDPDE